MPCFFLPEPTRRPRHLVTRPGPLPASRHTSRELAVWARHDNASCGACAHSLQMCIAPHRIATPPPLVRACDSKGEDSGAASVRSPPFTQLDYYGVRIAGALRPCPESGGRPQSNRHSMHGGRVCEFVCCMWVYLGVTRPVAADCLTYVYGRALTRTASYMSLAIMRSLTPRRQG